MTRTKNRLIIDGYNVIRSNSPYREIAESDMDSARTALLADVAGYSAADTQATIVFDGGANPQSKGDVNRIAGVEVIFSPYGREADSVIERLVADYRRDGEMVEVVTSDAQTQWAVMGETVTRRSAAEFVSELGNARDDWEEKSPAGSKSAPIGDRIDPAVRDTLERWARGER